MNIMNHVLGLILGDGHLELHKFGKNACLKLTRAIKDKNYLLFSKNKLINFLTEKSVSEGAIFDKRTNKIYYNIRLRTKCNRFFTSLHKKWYKNGKKTIPEDLCLNAEIIATWFADDGSIVIKKGRYSIKLSTHSFSENDIKILQKELSKFDIKTSLGYTDRKNKFQPILYITNKKNVKKFVDLIDPVFDFMDRKSDIWRKNYQLLNDKENVPCKFCLNKTFKNGKTYNNKVATRQAYKCYICNRAFHKKIN